MESPVRMEKPTLDVITCGDRKLEEKRRKAWKRAMKKILDIPRKEKKKVAEILHKWRKRQRKFLGHRNIVDPDPYHKTYVFYCLDM
jgi:hypothetical protein